MYPVRDEYHEDERALIPDIRKRFYEMGYNVQPMPWTEIDEWTLVFEPDRECSCCGRKGLVPKHHRYLCIICWATNGDMPNDTEMLSLEELDFEEKLLSETPKLQGKDTLEDHPPRVYKEIVYSSENMTQEELQAILS